MKGFVLMDLLEDEQVINHFNRWLQPCFGVVMVKDGYRLLVSL